ncbi:hypothetical protein M409DRAFT_62256 [Zasmidium cellare ATCC 36951]|uniref:tripeptidyl-peptidase II n=1 Tax=Zasmidium cellare ATCC 36951 TaxID=1080233 RepID=A0A6A6D3Y1_ZASCE|nr:uncharacterized protein M409DRAFT_62256 [Zasmidium cellare ATCC 36951]KAF2174121.1 hypothetical protein M409DRAFT_62256 [Zasmidium cellare ATCC 36951]
MLLNGFVLMFLSSCVAESKLGAVSSPTSPQYGKFFSVEELHREFALAPESAEKVKLWLQKSGATNINHDGNRVRFTATVANAKTMLDTDFKFYTNGELMQLRTDAYSVPDDLASHIDFISPTIYIGRLGKKQVTPPAADQMLLQDLANPGTPCNQSCETTISIPLPANKSESFDVLSPKCLQELYNTKDYNPDPKYGSNIASGNFLNQSASYSDLAQFEQMFNLPRQNFTVLALINGGVDNQDPASETDGEANLDVQNIVSIASGLPVYSYITGGIAPFVPNLMEPNQSYNQNEPYLEFYEYLLAQPEDKVPWVITNSYADDENTVPERYARRVCAQIGMLGLRGRTILGSSGDGGVGEICRANDGDNLKEGTPEFTPMFPSSCPYITSVGGTQSVGPEVAWNFSAGGFSNLFPVAWYQREAVDSYLNNQIDQHAKEYYTENDYVNFSGRGFPDVAAHSFYPDYVTIVRGTAYPNGGTSASSPIVAGIIALLNDARFRANRPAMGFLNPWLYSRDVVDALTDITSGGSLGCLGYNVQTNVPGTEGAVIPFASFNATAGWDPVTGLGTLNFARMKKLALRDSV